MAEMPDVTTGEVVASEWGNDIRDRTVQRYANQADLDAKLATPNAGDMAWVDDDGFMQIYDGVSWKTWFGGLGSKTIQITDALLAGPRVTTGTPVIRMTAVPSAVSPTYTFHDDVGTGLYRAGPGQIALAAGGVQKLGIATFFTSEPIADNTTTTPANVAVGVGGTNGRMLRSTASSARYKKDIEPLDVPGRLQPRRFRYIAGYVGDDPDGTETHFYFVAEEVADTFGASAVVLNDDGEPEDVRVKAVTAILAQQVNDLLDRVAALEAQAQ